MKRRCIKDSRRLHHKADQRQQATTRTCSSDGHVVKDISVLRPLSICGHTNQRESNVSAVYINVVSLDNNYMYSYCIKL